MSVILSIIVISHNQKEQLRRCVDSILGQDLPFGYEIIISDDASNDGTWELAQEYEAKYHCINAYHCNTNDYEPATNSERSGWNRCNGYKHTKGRYIAHIDADDFHLPNKNIYKKQVELLEMHPECACCMANDYNLNEDEDISQVKIRHKEVFETGMILSSEEYIKKYFRESHCFVYRRNTDINPVEVYGGYYVDRLLTSHYLQFGDIICLNDASYVYVHYKSSIWAKNKQSKDKYVLTPLIFIPYLIPKWKYTIIQTPVRIKQILDAVKLSLSGYKLSESSIKRASKFDIYLYKTFIHRKSIMDYFRLIILGMCLVMLYIYTPQQKWPYKIIYKLLY